MKFLITLLIFSVLTNVCYSASSQVNSSSLTNIKGDLIVPGKSCFVTDRINVQVGATCEVGNSDFSDGTGLLYLVGQTTSKIRGILTVNRDGDLLNNWKCSIEQNSGEGEATLITTGLFVNQNDLTIQNNGKLYCGSFPISIDNNSGVWEYKNASGNESEISIDYWRYGGIGSEVTATDYLNRCGILNGYYKHTNENIIYSYDSTNKKVFQDLTADLTAISTKIGTITFIPGAIISGVKIKNDCTIDISDPNINAQIKGGIIDVKKYIIIDNNNYKITLEEGVVIDNGQALNSHLQNAEILLFEDSELLNPVQLDISDDIKGANNGDTLFYNFTFTNCTANIPDEMGNSYKANRKDTSSSIIPLPNTSSDIYKQKRLLDENIYQLETGDSHNNYKKISQLFNSNIRNKIYHGSINNNEIGDVYKKEGEIYSIVTPRPQDGLILLNKSVGTDSIFSKLFNDYINYNCYIYVGDNNTVYTPTEDETNNLNLTFVMPDESGNKQGSTEDKHHQINLYIQLIGNKNVKINQKYQYNSNEYDFTIPLRLILYNPWEYKIGENSYNSYTGSIYRTLPSAINSTNRITQIHQNYDGPAFNHYKVNFINSKDTDNNDLSEDSEKNKFVNSEMLYYIVNSNSNNFSATNPNNSDKYFVSDQFSIGYSNVNVEINNIDYVSGNDTNKEKWNNLKESKILTQQFYIRGGSTFKLKGHLKVKKLTKGDYFNNGFGYSIT